MGCDVFLYLFISILWALTVDYTVRRTANLTARYIGEVDKHLAHSSGLEELPLAMTDEESEYKPSHDSPRADGLYGKDTERKTDEEAYDGGRHRKSSAGREDPFGDELNAEVKYRTLAWWQAGTIMIAETISLGILSLPSVLATVGLVGGIVTLIGLGIIATYTGYVLGQFKLAYPSVHNMADAGEILFEPLGNRMKAFGREFFGLAQVIFYLFNLGSHVLTWTIAFDTITGHATCNIVWAVIGMLVMLLFTLPRTLKKISYFSICCKPSTQFETYNSLQLTHRQAFISIFSAVLLTMIAIGIESPDARIQVTTRTSFPTAFGSITNIIFAYAGHVAFFSFISELKDPREYTKALYFLQGWDISMYVVASIVIYRYGGPDVASPSLGSTSPVVAKVAYGIALPTIVIAGVINAHVAAKYMSVSIAGQA